MTTANIYLSSVPTPPDPVSSPRNRPCCEETTKTTVTVVQGQFEDTVIKVEKEEVQTLSQITVELECMVPSCDSDGRGNKFKTPTLLKTSGTATVEDTQSWLSWSEGS